MIAKFSFFSYLILLAVCSSACVPFVFADENDLIGFSALSDGYWQIWRMDLDSGKRLQITDSPWDKKEPVWFNGGGRLIYRTTDAEFRLFHVDSGRETNLLEKYGAVFDPDLSENNEFLLFTRFRDDILDDSDIWRYDFAAKMVETLTNDPGLQYDPSWSPDHRKVVYVSSGKNEGHNLWVSDLAEEKGTPVTNDNAYCALPDWSQKGDKIVFSSNISGNYDIWTMNPDGGDKNRLTQDGGLDAQPAWSTDGAKLLFISNRSGDMRVWMMNADGSDQKALTPKGMKCADPVWLTN